MMAPNAPAGVSCPVAFTHLRFKWEAALLCFRARGGRDDLARHSTVPCVDIEHPPKSSAIGHRFPEFDQLARPGLGQRVGELRWTDDRRHHGRGDKVRNAES